MLLPVLIGSYIRIIQRSWYDLGDLCQFVGFKSAGEFQENGLLLGTCLQNIQYGRRNMDVLLGFSKAMRQYQLLR